MNWDSLLETIDTESDWPDEAFPFRNIERSLKCAICHGTMDGPVILSTCGHSFCSYCIRQYLYHEKFCPLCRQPATESDIVRNVALGEIIEVFKQHRTELLKLLRDLYPKKEKKDESSTSTANKLKKDATLLLSSSSKRSTSTTTTVDNPDCITTDSYSECDSTASDDSDSDFEDETPSYKQSKSSRKSQQYKCPICNRYFDKDIIEEHASLCDGRSNKKHKNTFNGFIPQTTENRRPMESLCYKVMKMPELKKRLQQVNLSTSGSFNELVERHRQYTLRYNAELDKINPLPPWKIAQIVMANEEKTKKHR